MTIDKATHFRVAPCDVLIRELEEFAADRESHGKLERAAAARAAAAKLAAGAPRVFVERTWRVIGDEHDRYSAYVGSREQVVAELHDASEGWSRFGKMPLAMDARAAAGRVLAGEKRVQVGHLVYEVVDDMFAGTRAEVLDHIGQRGMRAARVHLKGEERELLAARDVIQDGGEHASAAGVDFVVVGE